MHLRPPRPTSFPYTTLFRSIVHVVRFAVGVQRAGFRIVAKANRTHLMRHACQGNSLTDVQVPSEQSLVALVAVNLRSEEHTSELQSRQYLVCPLLLRKK